MRLGCLCPAIWLRSDPGCGSLFQESLPRYNYRHSDPTTIASFRERLFNAVVIEVFFEKFEAYLRAHGLQARGGQIIDETLVSVPLPKASAYQ